MAILIEKKVKILGYDDKYRHYALYGANEDKVRAVPFDAIEMDLSNL